MFKSAFRSKSTRICIGMMFMLFTPLFLWGQGQNSIDSLQRLLDNTRSDSTRIELLVELSIAYQYVDYERAKSYANQAVEIADQKNLNWAKLISYKQQGFLSALRGDFTSALKFDKMRLPIALATQDSVHLASALNFIGNDYVTIGEYDEAYYYFTQSYKVSNAIKDSAQVAIALHNVGIVFKELGQFDIALNHIAISENLSEKVNDLDGPAYNNSERGDIYLRKGEYDSAEYFLKEALRITKKRKIDVLQPDVVVLLARLNLRRNNFENANAFYDTAALLHQKTQNVFGIAQSKLGKGRVLLKQRNYEQAMILISEALTTSKVLNARKLEIECNKSLAILYEELKDYENALIYTKYSNTLRDSLFSEEMLEKLFLDQLKFQTENKDLVIAALNETQEKQAVEIKRQSFLRNILVVVVALVIFFLYTVYRSGQRRIKINKLLISHQNEIKKRSVELEQLNQVKDKFFSVISHDLRSPINALSGILDLMASNNIKPDELPKLTKELRLQFNHTKELINNLLDWALVQMDKLNIQMVEINLRKMVDDNFELLSSLHLKEVTLENKIPENATAMADMNMINLVFRNLILNAIKFTKSGGKIVVETKEESDQYVVSIADNGVGINQEVQKILFEKTSGYSTRGTANEKGTGLGLILCKEFVERNGGKIWLKSQEQKGSTFFFTVPKANQKTA